MSEFKSKAKYTSIDFDKISVYDVESMGAGEHCMFSLAHGDPNHKDRRQVFEISYRKNHFVEVMEYFYKMMNQGYHMCGYNNSEYDWYICNWMLENEDSLGRMSGGAIATKIKEVSNHWFNHYQKNQNAWFAYKSKNTFWPTCFKIPQMDLMAIAGLNKRGAMVGLKTLQYSMGFPSIRTLPYKPNEPVTPEMIDNIIDYNMNNDVEGTIWFYHKLLEGKDLDFRAFTGDELGKNTTCYAETKIAKILAQNEFENRGLDLFYEDEKGDRKPHQTLYPEGVKVKDLIFDYIKFNTDRFQAIHKWFGEQVIFDTNGVFSDLPIDTVKNLLDYTNPENIKVSKGEKVMKKLSIHYDGVDFDFGMGGIHASEKEFYVKKGDGYKIIDVDAKSFYPFIIFKNGIYPKHIGPEFYEFAEEVFNKRAATQKSDPWNKTYKLLLNSFFFGQLNEASSFIYDKGAALQICINGQLMLCMMSESIVENCSDTHVIQANTDGVTFKVHEDDLELFNKLIKEFEDVSGMIMEAAEYDYMAIRDVNNYIAQFSDIPENGSDRNKTKLIGCYAYEKLAWSKDFSRLVVKKAVAAYFRDGITPEEFIPKHDIDHDFTLRINIDKRYNLMGLIDGNGDNKLFSKVSIGDRLTFQRMTRDDSLDIKVEIDKIDDVMEYSDYLKQEFSDKKKIDFDDVTDKDISRKFKSIPSKAKYIGERLAVVYNVPERVGKLLARWYLDSEGCLDMQPVKGKRLSSVTAYYVAKEGYTMLKETLPTEDSPARGKFNNVEKDCKLFDCNDMATFNRENVDYQWYIDAAWDLINPIKPR
ncbi:hypothetical protein N9043_00900 [bacterium]|nr:hypothetical protein [bacterium]